MIWIWQKGRHFLAEIFLTEGGATKYQPLNHVLLHLSSYIHLGHCVQWLLFTLAMGYNGSCSPWPWGTVGVAICPPVVACDKNQKQSRNVIRTYRLTVRSEKGAAFGTGFLQKQGGTHKPKSCWLWKHVARRLHKLYILHILHKLQVLHMLHMLHTQQPPLCRHNQPRNSSNRGVVLSSMLYHTWYGLLLSTLA